LNRMDIFSFCMTPQQREDLEAESQDTGRSKAWIIRTMLNERYSSEEEETDK